MRPLGGASITWATWTDSLGGSQPEDGETAMYKPRRGLWGTSPASPPSGSSSSQTENQILLIKPLWGLVLR